MSAFQLEIPVVAPCDMEAGYTFIAQTASGEDIPVTVPEGGVRKGQVILSRSASPSSIIGSLTNLTERSPLVQQNYVEGTWKDEWWDCCRFGPFHVSLWNACLCPQILAAQIMTRLRLNWLADPVSSEQGSTRTFARVALIVTLYWILSTVTAPPVPVDVQAEDDVTAMLIEVRNDLPQPSCLRFIFYHTVSIAFGVYTLVILTKLRHRVRRLYQIPPKQYFVCMNSDPNEIALDDCCMAFWCGCCSVAQLARQTADYSQEPAACCSSTGLLTAPQAQEHRAFTKSRSAPTFFVV